LRIKEFQDEEISCHCPDALHDGFLVLEGRVAITHQLRGLEHVLELGGFGTVFNLEGLVGIEKSHGAARALGRVRLLVMDTTLLMREFDSHPEVGYPLIKNFAKLLIVQHDKVFEHWVI
jgi:CRP-like cAMP-binding protein